MQADLDIIKQEFTQIASEDFGSDKMLRFVVNVWESVDLSPNDAGWVLWNICDQYALGRANDPVAQYGYQSEFFELVKQNFPERAHWVVMDGTQGASLINGGYREFWTQCYDFANENAPRTAENRTARSQAHKTNTFLFTRFGPVERAKSALDAMADLLGEDDEWARREFWHVTHETYLTEFYAATGQADKVEETGLGLEAMLEDWLPRAGSSIKILRDGPLLGSWQSLTEDPPPDDGFYTALSCAACVFARTGQFVGAERLFRMWVRHFGRPLPGYCQALFLQSCWRNGYGKEEINRMLDESNQIRGESKRVSRTWLIETVPEMADVVR